MTPWIVLAVYVVGWFGMVRFLHGGPGPRAPFLDTGLALVWPIVLVIAGSIWAGIGVYRLATMPIRNPFRRKVKDGDPQRIAELEYELGITTTPPPGTHTTRFEIDGQAWARHTTPNGITRVQLDAESLNASSYAQTRKTNHRSCCGALASVAMTCQEIDMYQDALSSSMLRKVDQEAM